MPKQTIMHLIQTVVSDLRQKGQESPGHWAFNEKALRTNPHFYSKEDLNAAAAYFTFLGLQANFAQGVLTVNRSDEFDFGNLEWGIPALRDAGFDVRIKANESVDIFSQRGKNPDQLRKNLVNAFSAGLVRSDSSQSLYFDAVNDRAPLLGGGAPASLPQAAPPRRPLDWEEVCDEVTSQNPRWPAILTELSSQEPLDYFQCPILLDAFSHNQIINILPNGALCEKVAIDTSIQQLGINPTTNEQIAWNINLAVYIDLMNYIQDPSDVNLRKLCQDSTTGKVMDNPRIITYYNKLSPIPSVQFKICDQSTVGNRKLSAELKQEFFGSRYISDTAIQNTAFDSLKNFIEHPKILPRLLSPEQAAPRLKNQLLIKDAELRQKAEEAQQRERARLQQEEFRRLTVVKDSYTEYRKTTTSFEPIRFFFGLIKSHAAKVIDARSMQEISQLLWESYKKGGNNASTKAINDAQVNLDELSRVKKTYFRHRHAFFNPVRFFGLKSHAAKVQDARSMEEITRLLWSSHKPGGRNASTATVNELNIIQPALRR